MDLPPPRPALQPSILPGPSATGTQSLAVFAVVIAALYFGRDRFVPLALAGLLSFALAPLIAVLRRRGMPKTPAVLAVVMAAEPLRRFFVMSVETGLRPGDLRRLTRNHVEATEKGRRIFLRTSKRKRDVSIPVTARAAEIIDATPARQLLICASPTGLVWDAGNFGADFRAARKEAKIRSELRLYDTRGTAATLLLHAGLGLDEIAVWMGWSLQYAVQMIATYARVDPDKTDATLVKLAPWLAQRAARMAAAK